MNSTPEHGDETVAVEPSADTSVQADAVTEQPETTDAGEQSAPSPESPASASEASSDQPSAADVEPQVLLEPDPVLLASHDLALSALREITPSTTIGVPAGYRVEPDGVVSLRFENLLPGYPGWYWTVSLAHVPDADPTVLEVELLPSDDALVAPDWTPWAVRLAEYHAAQAAMAELADEEDSDLDDGSDDDDEDDVDDLDAADFDEDGSRILHAGDVDGVDIDELDGDPEDDESDDDDDSDDDDSDDDDDDSDDNDSDHDESDDDDDSDDDEEDDSDDEDSDDDD